MGSYKLNAQENSMSHLQSTLSTGTCPHRLFRNNSKANILSEAYSLQLPSKCRAEAVLLSISQCRGKMVSGSALKLFLSYTVYPSKSSKPFAALRRIRIPVDIIPFTGTRLNLLLIYRSDQCWNEVMQVLPKLAIFSSSCIGKEETSKPKDSQKTSVFQVNTKASFQRWRQSRLNNCYKQSFLAH